MFFCFELVIGWCEGQISTVANKSFFTISILHFKDAFSSEDILKKSNEIFISPTVLSIKVEHI